MHHICTLYAYAPYMHHACQPWGMLGLGEVRRRGESYVAVRQMFWTDSCNGLRIGMGRGESLRDGGRVGASLSEKKIMLAWV